MKRVAPVMADPEFNVATMKKKSDAAANLCSWVINIVTFNRIYLKVKPLMERLAVAQATKAEAQATLDAVKAIVAEVAGAASPSCRRSSWRRRTEKARVEAEAAACNDRLSLANRLVNGLASENERWAQGGRAALRERSTMVPGDVLLSAAFVSYIGAFNSTLRNSLWKEVWLSDIISREILISEGIDPLEVLTNDSKSAEWQNQGLAADRISIENGAIITQCARWPLIIDPQLQGIKWLRTREAAAAEGKDGKELVVVQLTQQSWMTKIHDGDPDGQHDSSLRTSGRSIDAGAGPGAFPCGVPQGDGTSSSISAGRRWSTTRTSSSSCRPSWRTRTTSRRSPRSAR